MIKILLRIYHTPSAIVRIGEWMWTRHNPNHPATQHMKFYTKEDGGINMMPSNICSERKYKVRTRRRTGGSRGRLPRKNDAWVWFARINGCATERQRTGVWAKDPEVRNHLHTEQLRAVWDVWWGWCDWTVRVSRKPEMIWGRWSAAGSWALCPLMKFGLTPKTGGFIKIYRQGNGFVGFTC